MKTQKESKCLIPMLAKVKNNVIQILNFGKKLANSVEQTMVN
jgi:hypothetical protein